MNESVIIQKLIQVGQMLERGELEYSGAEADTKHYLEQYLALRQPFVSGAVCETCKGTGKIFHWEFGQFVKCGICQADR